MNENDLIRMDKKSEINNRIRLGVIYHSKPSLLELIKSYMIDLLYYALIIALCILYALTGGSNLFIFILK